MSRRARNCLSGISQLNLISKLSISSSAAFLSVVLPAVAIMARLDQSVLDSPGTCIVTGRITKVDDANATNKNPPIVSITVERVLRGHASGTVKGRWTHTVSSTHLLNWLKEPRKGPAVGTHCIIGFFPSTNAQELPGLDLKYTYSQTNLNFVQSYKPNQANVVLPAPMDGLD